MNAFFDLCLRSPEAARFAGELGFSGVGIVLDYDPGVLERLAELRKSGTGFGVWLKSPGKAPALRRKVELIVSEGRAALESREVDIAFCQEVDYVMARLARRNNVAIAFSLHPLLHSSKRGRSDLLAGMHGAARLARKYRSPFVLTSGAVSQWDMRSASDLIAFGKVLGFQESECKKALSGSILKENRKRLGKGWVMPGVEKEPSG